jgi:sarcosine oxidase gamma subunit
VSDLAFLSPGRASAEATWRSPLERALREAPPEISDLSLTGKIEIRGDLPKSVKGAELVRITPSRGLVLCDFTKTIELLEKLSADYVATDVSGTLAGLSVRGEALMRRITDLDLDALPAAGAVSHVQVVVTRDGDSFALWFAQEYSDYLAEVVIDAHEGLHR